MTKPSDETGKVEDYVNGHKNVARFFEASTNAFSNRPLMRTIENEGWVSYGDMKIRVDECANALLALGLNERETVLMTIPNSPDFFVVFMALIRISCVPVLVNPQLSQQELQVILGICHARFCVGAEQGDSVGYASQLQFIAVDEICSSEAGRSENSVPQSSATLDDIAYIIFSSGSTGTPKGCQITHANLLSELFSMQRAYDLSGDCNHLCVLPVYHVSALYRNLLIPFSQGASIVVAPEFQKENFWDWIDANDIGFVQVVPTIINALLAMAPQADDKSHGKVLKYIGSASAPHKPSMIREFEARFGHRVAQGYGLSETSCGVCFNHPDERADKIGSVGKPVDVAQVTILDEQGQALPAGETGSISVKGPLLMHGYVGDETGGKNISEAGILTGDIGFLDEDGYLFIEGRSSDLIIRGGNKVSPKEVEEALVEFPQILDAVVFGVPNALLGEDVISYVWLHQDGGFNESEIRKQISDKLVRYKVPTRILLNTETFQQKDFKKSRAHFKKQYTAGRVSVIKDVPPASLEGKPRAFIWNDNIYLRPIMKTDTTSDLYFNSIMDPQLQKYTYAGRFPMSEFELEEYWQGVKTPDQMAFSICDRHTDQHVGSISLRVDWVARIGDFGRLIYRDFQDKPYAHDALQLVMKYAFEELHLTRLWGSGANPASLPSLMRLGFVPEGTLRRHHFLRGQWRDQFMVGILADEYFDIKENGLSKTARHFPPFEDEFLGRLKAVIENAFIISIDDFSVQTAITDIEQWDSLGTVMIWNCLEEEFEIEISPSDMIDVFFVGDLAMMVQQKMMTADSSA
ncbi:GNAT family N-acetyltransferase [Magnetovibrio sp. PR-2]|uniref:GNAT family N-acetyltransferase n=1 Tax=Magnetovibrio sp. PR-2 TaxID=3120356 RepID=UPI002FCE2FD5